MTGSEDYKGFASTAHIGKVLARLGRAGITCQPPSRGKRGCRRTSSLVAQAAHSAGRHVADLVAEVQRARVARQHRRHLLDRGRPIAHRVLLIPQPRPLPLQALPSLNVLQDDSALTIRVCHISQLLVQEKLCMRSLHSTAGSMAHSVRRMSSAVHSLAHVGLPNHHAPVMQGWTKRRWSTP